MTNCQRWNIELQIISSKNFRKSHYSLSLLDSTKLNSASPCTLLQSVIIQSYHKQSSQASPLSSLRAAPQGNPQPPKIPAPRTSGLAQSFCRLPHNQPFCCFFCHTFCNPPTIWHIAFSRSSKKSISQSTHKAKKTSGTPTATTVPNLRQRKNQPKAMFT